MFFNAAVEAEVVPRRLSTQRCLLHPVSALAHTRRNVSKIRAKETPGWRGLDAGSSSSSLDHSGDRAAQ